MDIYSLYFASLALLNGAIFYHRSQETKEEHPKEDILTLSDPQTEKEEVAKFKWTYFSVYILVMAGDWLQGPYIYTVYKDEKGLSDSIVNALLMTGFVCAGITASFAGSLADKHGRRLACQVFCVAYSVSCLSVLSNDLMVLFVGRALGGLSTTLLYSVFETWMVAEYHSRGLSDSLSLGDVFSSSVTFSSIVAILAGIVGEAVVGYTGTKTAPFILGIVCFGLAFSQIQRTWGENYGESSDAEKPTTSPTLKAMLFDKRIFTLAFATTIFEGSMYLWVCFWSPALKAARGVTSTTTDPLPFGVIFSCFMCAMMMGSMLFAAIELRSARDSGRLLMSILAMAANALFIPVLAGSEVVTFWSFVLFEMCVGLYFPTMGRLKSELVDDAVRGNIYSLIRLPLNTFVVVALGIASGGDSHRNMVFTAIGAMLLGAFLVVQKLLL